jgi:hypothetical protein
MKPKTNKIKKSGISQDFFSTKFYKETEPNLTIPGFSGLASRRISIESICTTLAKTANCKTESPVTYVFVLFITGDICCTEHVFLNVYGAQESVPRHQFRINSVSLCSLAGRYDNPIPTLCLAPIDLLKIPAQYYSTVYTQNKSFMRIGM